MTDLSLPTGTVMGAVASWSVDEMVRVCPSEEREASERTLEMDASRRAVMAAVMVSGGRYTLPYKK